MSKKTLILLTKKYPFGIGEEFIENEIIHLSKDFEEILIISTATSRYEIQTRDLPSNESLIRITDIQNKWLRRIIYGIAGILRFNDSKVQDEFNSLNKFGQRMGALYIQGRVGRILQSIVRDDKFHTLIENSHLTIYSYWFADISYLASLLSEEVFKYTNIKPIVVSRAHGYDLYHYRNIINHMPFRNYVMKSINFVFPCSIDGKNYLSKLYPKHASKIKTSYLGTNDYGYLEFENNDSYTIVTCSEINYLKRYHILAETLKILEDRHPNFLFNWICIGGGPLLDSLKKYTEKELFTNKVEFKGYLPNREVMGFYKSNYVDLFINISESEGLPVSIMEAQSFGIPTLATDVGGTREIVKDNINGFLISPNITVETVYKSIIRFVELSNERKRRLRAEARLFWETHFNAERNYSKFSTLIKMNGQEKE